MVDLTEGVVPVLESREVFPAPVWAFKVWGDNAAFCDDCRGWHHINFHEHRKPPRWRIDWAWYDLWVGAYYDALKRTWYFCPLPTIVITYNRKPR